MFGLSDPQPSQSVINKHANVLANICKSAADSCYSTLTDVCVSVCMCACVCMLIYLAPQMRNKLNQEQNSKLQQHKDMLNKRNLEVSMMDRRIEELRERLYRKKAEVCLTVC